MCGIIGMISDGQPVIYEMLKSIGSQVNRGKHSCGLVGSLEEEFGFKKRNAGTPDVVFKDIDISDILDSSMIGHVRYATSGKNYQDDAQPLYVGKPGMAMAHNGQIANYLELKEKLNQRKDYLLATGCDVEVLMFALAQNLIDLKSYEAKDTSTFVHEKLFPALSTTMDSELNRFYAIGAYSAVVLIPKHGLLAFKDPHGIRPLTYAKKETDRGVIHAFASEYINLPQKFDFKEHEEFKPGEAIFIDNKLNVYRQTILDLGPKICPFEAIYFSQAHSLFNGMSIRQIRSDLGLSLAFQYKDLKDRIDHVVPVPKTPIPTAETISNAWSKPYGGIEAITSIRVFQGADQKEREQSAKDKFSFDERVFRGKNILVVDDSIVRGTNSKSVIEVLRQLGAREVHFMSTYPPYVGICPGGIDVAKEEELLLTENTASAIEVARQKIGADSLNFLSMPLMLNALGLTEDQICTGCTKKVYPFDMADYRRYQVLREQERIAQLSKKRR